jgi:hypothetical protein
MEKRGSYIMNLRKFNASFRLNSIALKKFKTDANRISKYIKTRSHKIEERSIELNPIK